MNDLNILARQASDLNAEATKLTGKIYEIIAQHNNPVVNDHFIGMLTVFLLSCFVGYYVVWKVTPALHTPLMSVTNAISGIIIIGALLITGFEHLGSSTIFGVLGIFLASINIFGGFVVTYRMLKMFEKK
jgi:NAD(P) transhydrogenase subunit alpha